MKQQLNEIKADIENSRTALGIEFGSTRIKAVLIDSSHSPIASGSFEWENRLDNGVWTYSLEDVWHGLQISYQTMAAEVKSKYGITLQKVGSIGFSAMMHGYLAFDEQGELLTPFRTWRNSMTAQAEEELTALFHFNIPQRWSIAHLYQAILNEEKHVEDLAFLTTLSGYVHWKLTGEKVLGVGDASGMFPIGVEGKSFDEKLLHTFGQLISPKQYRWKVQDVLPRVLPAGSPAGLLSDKGAALLDTSGQLQPGIPLCPPEGDAGTGMVATNSVAKRTGNVSAGTSVFAMIVLEKELKKVHPEIDLVTTPSGSLVGMVHANNCSSDINAWVKLFQELVSLAGADVNKDKLFELLFNQALQGDADGGGLLSYGYFSGENITGMKEGRPLFVRSPESQFNLANFMRVHLFSSIATLKIGMDILFEEEHVQIDKITGHGGLFKTKEVGQKMMAAAMNAPVSVMETAGEGGAWGMALLASYMGGRETNESLEEYLDQKVFVGNNGMSVTPEARDVEGFEAFMKRYKQGLAIEQAAVDHFTH